MDFRIELVFWFKLEGEVKLSVLIASTFSSTKLLVSIKRQVRKFEL